jgi:hypothetical protein
MLNFKTRIERLPKLQKFLPRLKAQVKGLPFCNTRDPYGLQASDPDIRSAGSFLVAFLPFWV